MKPVENVAEVFAAIQKTKAGALAFCTNFFPVERKLQGWIGHGELLGELRDGVAFFLRKDRDFWHFYFAAASLPALQREIAALPSLKTERVVVDLVGNEAALDAVLALLEAAGFRRHTRLYRMARTSQAGPEQFGDADTRVSFAERADCETILDLLGRSFDRYAEQLPMLYEIESAVESRQILVAKREGALGGLLFFETQGFTSTVRYWLVSEPFRALHFGSALMRRYLAAHNAVRRFILWVIADNLNAIEKYQHYGFKPDGLVDHVLANQMVRL
jgi:ribosomal protein S18 acetylase RimI-like enzyme